MCGILKKSLAGVGLEPIWNEKWIQTHYLDPSMLGSRSAPDPEHIELRSMPESKGVLRCPTPLLGIGHIPNIYWAWQHAQYDRCAPIPKWARACCLAPCTYVWYELRLPYSSPGSLGPNYILGSSLVARAQVVFFRPIF